MTERPNKTNTVGKQFGRLTAIRRLPSSTNSNYKWEFKCDCDTVIVAYMGNVKSGRTQSCGCLLKEFSFKHGFSESERLYQTWRNMKSRCYYEGSPFYKRYGGRGIKVYKAWRENYLAFREYVINLPNFPVELLSLEPNKDKITIDRIDNNKDYTPGNVRWSSPEEQQRNKENTLFVTYKNKRVSLARLCEIKRVSRGTVYKRLKRGWTLESALA